MKPVNIEEFAEKVVKRNANSFCEDLDLPILGAGSSRVVYAIDSKHAIKIAMNKKGFAQNKAELEIWENLETDGLVADIYYYCSDYSWIIVQRANGNYDECDMSERSLKRFHDALRPMGVNEICEFGRTKKGYVLIDYGCTLDVCKKYYNWIPNMCVSI